VGIAWQSQRKVGTSINVGQQPVMLLLPICAAVPL
jgi:hypothetical protein